MSAKVTPHPKRKRKLEKSLNFKEFLCFLPGMQQLQL